MTLINHTQPSLHVPAIKRIKPLWIGITGWLVSALIAIWFISVSIESVSDKSVWYIQQITGLYDGLLNAPEYRWLLYLYGATDIIATSVWIALSLSVGQILTLSLYIPRAWRWGVSCVSSWFFAGLLRLVLSYRTEEIYDYIWFYAQLLSAPLLGLVFGFFQMRFFRPYSKRAKWWLIIHPVAFLLGEWGNYLIDQRIIFASIHNEWLVVFSKLFPYTLVLAPVLWWMLKGMQFGADGKAMPIDKSV